MSDHATNFTEDTAGRVVAATRQVEQWQGQSGDYASPLPVDTLEVAADSPVQLCIVIESGLDPQGYHLEVKPVVHAVDGNGHWDGEYKIVNRIYPVFVYPGLVNEDYQAFATKEIEIGAKVTVLPIWKIGIAWHVLQFPKYGFKFQDAEFAMGGCRPVVTTGGAA